MNIRRYCRVNNFLKCDHDIVVMRENVIIIKIHMLKYFGESVVMPKICFQML